jgi:hypothetical protein
LFSEKGAELLECPITGGLDALKKGQMATWVAGNKVLDIRLLLSIIKRENKSGPVFQSVSNWREVVFH